jgi:50S ribosomal protein L16 3-hydroxylase
MNQTLPLTLLGGISPQQFINEYWQKKTLLIRQAIPSFECPVTSDELAGFAMEEEVESRIVQEKTESGHWQAQNGPFSEDDYAKLPKKNWTLLVQQLDAWVPEINKLKQRFDFIPNWRFDDIMASYAPEGGSVGPHYDQYDVFLFQAEGKRHWRTGQVCNEHSPRLDNTPLRILSDFDESGSWVLEPGDMLYLPPNIAHYGVALDKDTGQGDCITLSIGYKAPTHTQILSHFADFLLEQVNPYGIYEDSDLQAQANAGEITSVALSKVQKIIEQYTQNPTHLKQWFGEFTTTPKNDESLQANISKVEEEEVQTRLRIGEELYKNEASRFAYSKSEGHKTLQLFVDGNSFILGIDQLDFVQTLCNEPAISIASISDDEIENLDILVDLLEKGSLYFED